MQGIAQQNNGVQYDLNFINVFSKYALVAPTNSKDEAAVTAAFSAVLLLTAPRGQRYLQTNMCKVFFNLILAAYTKINNKKRFAN